MSNASHSKSNASHRAPCRPRGLWSLSRKRKRILAPNSKRRGARLAGAAWLWRRRWRGPTQYSPLLYVYCSVYFHRAQQQREPPLTLSTASPNTILRRIYCLSVRSVFYIMASDNDRPAKGGTGARRPTQRCISSRARLRAARDAAS